MKTVRLGLIVAFALLMLTTSFLQPTTLPRHLAGRGGDSRELR